MKKSSRIVRLSRHARTLRSANVCSKLHSASNPGNAIPAAGILRCGATSTRSLSPPGWIGIAPAPPIASQLFSALEIVRKELGIYASVQGWNQDIAAALQVAKTAIEAAAAQEVRPQP